MALEEGTEVLGNDPDAAFDAAVGSCDAVGAELQTPTARGGPGPCDPLLRQAGSTGDARLVVRSPPVPGEGLPEWLTRVSGLNGYAGRRSILEMTGLDWRKDVDPGLLAGRLGSLAGIDPRSILPLLSFGIRAAFDAMPAAYAGDIVTAAAMRICPVCVREGGFAFAAWRLPFWTACPAHGVAMVDSCPTCDRAITGERPDLDRCGVNGCRGSLLSAAPVPADPKVVSALSLIASAMERPDLARDHPLHARLGCPSLPEVARLVTVLGIDPEKAGVGGHRGIERWKDLTRTFAAALWDWPSGFHTLLDGYRLRSRPNNNIDGIYGNVAKYCGGYARFGDLEDSLVRSMVREEMMRYLRDHRHAYALTNRMFDADRVAATCHSISEAARMLKVSLPTLRLRVNAGEIAARGRIGRGSPVLIEAAEIERYARANNLARDAAAERRSALICQKDAMATLGIGPPLMRALILEGVIKIHRRMKLELFDHDEVDGLKRKFEAAPIPGALGTGRVGSLSRSNDDERAPDADLKAPSRRQSCDGSNPTLDLRQIVQLMPIRPLIEMVTRDRIKAVRRGAGAGLNTLEFDREVILGLRRRLMHERSMVDASGAANLLDCKAVGLKLLREANLVRLADGRREFGCLAYDLTSINAFSRTYIFTKGIPRKRGETKSDIDSRLRQNGVVPTLEHVTRATETVWPLHEVEAVFGRIRRDDP